MNRANAIVHELDEFMLSQSHRVALFCDQQCKLQEEVQKLRRSNTVKKAMPIKELDISQRWDLDTVTGEVEELDDEFEPSEQLTKEFPRNRFTDMHSNHHPEGGNPGLGRAAELRKIPLYEA